MYGCIASWSSPSELKPAHTVRMRLLAGSFFQIKLKVTGIILYLILRDYGMGCLV